MPLTPLLRDQLTEARPGQGSRISAVVVRVSRACWGIVARGSALVESDADGQFSGVDTWGRGSTPARRQDHSAQGPPQDPGLRAGRFGCVTVTRRWLTIQGRLEIAAGLKGAGLLAANEHLPRQYPQVGDRTTSSRSATSSLSTWVRLSNAGKASCPWGACDVSIASGSSARRGCDGCVGDRDRDRDRARARLPMATRGASPTANRRLTTP